MRLPDRNRLISRRSPRTLIHETFRRQAHRRHPLVPEKSAPLAADARFLERPQGAQRDLLCLGKAPDARDIQALVGSIPPQCLERLATPQVPEPDGPVIPATGQPGAIGAHLERLHRPLMRLSHPHALSILHVPPAQPAITASTDKPLPTRTPDHRKGRARMLGQGTDPLPAVGIPHKDLSVVTLSLVARARGHLPAIGTPRHAPDHPAVPHQTELHHAAPGIPQADAAIIAATG